MIAALLSAVRLLCVPTEAPEIDKQWTPDLVWETGYLSMGLAPAKVWLINRADNTIAAEDARYRVVLDIEEVRGSQISARSQGTFMEVNTVSGEMALYYSAEADDVTEWNTSHKLKMPEHWSWRQRCRVASPSLPRK